MDRFDWNLARAFQVTAAEGSLSAAARALGLSQPTLSRQVAALEDSLGVSLFERVGKRLVLTEAGNDLLAHAARMREAADTLALAAAGRSQALEGFVTISAGEAFAVHTLPRLLERIRAAAPGLSIEVVVSNAISDLRRREADIAIRHVPPQEDELIGKYIREATAHFYAARSWVVRHGLPRTAADARGVDFIGVDRSEQYPEQLRERGLPVEQLRLPIVTANWAVSWQLVQHGLGIGVMVSEVGDATPGVVRVLEAVPPFRFPIWLVTHRELRTSQRIRIVFDMLDEMLR